MAKSGKQAWEKYYNGNDGVSVKVKKASAYYGDEKTSKQEGILPINGTIIYRDLSSQHIKNGGNNKIAFQFVNNGPVYYSSVDNFVKPGRSSGVGLKPTNFGLQNQTFLSGLTYYNFVVNALDERLKNKEIGGELYEYLLAILNYAKTGVINFSGIQKDDLPWGEINSYFGEVAGPLACVSGHCSNISTIISSASNCKIYMPDDSVPLYDYKLINSGSGKEYMISAKSGKSVSNTVKPQFITGSLNGIIDDAKLTQLKTTTAYQVIQILANNDAKSGPFYAYQLISNSLTNAMISSIISVYRTNSDSIKKIKDLQLLLPFINQIKKSNNTGILNKDPKNMTVGLLRYACEQEIKRWSTGSSVNSQLKNIFEKYLEYSRVIYVKMSASVYENPKFTAFGGEYGNVKKVNSIELRSKNDSISRVSDRIGFQVG